MNAGEGGDEVAVPRDTRGDRNVLPPAVSPVTVKGMPDGYDVTQWAIEYGGGLTLRLHYTSGDRGFHLRSTESPPDRPARASRPTTVQGKPAQRYAIAGGGEPLWVFTRLVWQQPSGFWVELGADNRTATPEELHVIADSVADEETTLRSSLAVDYLPAGYQLGSYQMGDIGDGTVGSASFDAGTDPTDRLTVTLNTGTIPDVSPTIRLLANESQPHRRAEVPMGPVRQVDGVAVRVSADGFAVARQVDAGSWIRATSPTLAQAELIRVAAGAGRGTRPPDLFYSTVD